MTTKERIWLACRDKRCCSYYVVVITFHDLVRIARQFELAPSFFTRYMDAPSDSADAFRLDASERGYHMILAKQPQTPDGLAPCAFLWRLPDGHAQCALGDGRPSICRAYPFLLYGSLLGVAESTGCSCRTWARAQVDGGEERELAQRVEIERAEHRVAVREWNRRMTASTRNHSFVEYCDFLIGWHNVA